MYKKKLFFNQKILIGQFSYNFEKKKEIASITSKKNTILSIIIDYSLITDSNYTISIYFLKNQKLY